MKSGVRIIGGKWRGRKLAVTDVDGLRPTPDRIRETLFNWLASRCRGAAVLDCFAGSGALGLEAMSRGAESLLAIERNPAVLATLRGEIEKLGENRIELLGGDALAATANLRREFDLVFIDPPYAQGHLRTAVFEQLEARGLLRDRAVVYFEWPRVEQFELPSTRLEWLKQKGAGQIYYAIAEWRVTG